jgi:hypothetical protein
MISHRISDSFWKGTDIVRARNPSRPASRNRQAPGMRSHATDHAPAEHSLMLREVPDATLIYVAIDDSGLKREIPVDAAAP